MPDMLIRADGSEAIPVALDGATTSRVAALSLRVRGHDYPLRFAFGCKTCNSPYRYEIEVAMLGGRGAPSIVRGLPEGHGLSAENINDHRTNGHSPADTAVMTALMQEEFEGDIDEANGTIVTALGLLKNVVRLGFEGIQSGDIRVNLKETVAAAAILVQLQMAQSEEKDDIAAMQTTIQIVLEHCRNVLAPPEYAALSNAIQADPNIMRLRKEHEERHRELSA